MKTRKPTARKATKPRTPAPPAEHKQYGPKYKTARQAMNSSAMPAKGYRINKAKLIG